MGREAFRVVSIPPDVRLCALHDTYPQVLTGDFFGFGPMLAERRESVDDEFAGRRQHDVFEFLEKFLDRARTFEIDSGRYGL